jgi:hypothetical protein
MKYVSIPSAWPNFVTKKTKKKPLPSFSSLRGSREQDFRKESIIDQTGEERSTSRVIKKISSMREDISMRKAARRRLNNFINQK